MYFWKLLFLYQAAYSWFVLFSSLFFLRIWPDMGELERIRKAQRMKLIHASFRWKSASFETRWIGR